MVSIKGSITLFEIKDGLKGDVLHTWIKYADDIDGNGLTDISDGSKKCIGIAYNKLSPIESTDPKDYNWTLLVGGDGYTPIKGKDYTDGATLYTWIKYADDIEGNGLADAPDGKNYIGIAYNKTTSTESTNKEDYKFSLIVGKDGNTPTKGEDYNDGITYYTWIKYADDINGSNLTDIPDGKNYIGIAYNKTMSLESTNPSDYKWSLIKGEDAIGKDGSFKSFIFKVTNEKPTTPTGGTYNGTDEDIPNGWTDDPTHNDSDDTEWVSSCVYSKNNDNNWIKTAWITPVKYYQKGADGIDGSFKSFVYKVSNSEPTKPIGGAYNGTDEDIPNGWTDDPTHSDSDDIEWVSTRIYYQNSKKEWNGTSWSQPVKYYQSGTASVTADKVLEVIQQIGDVVMIGNNNSATESGAVAIGDNNISDNNYCLTIGKDNKAGTPNENGDKFSLGVAIGLENVSNGSYSFASGYQNKSTDTASLSFGYGNEASSSCATAIGMTNIASSQYCIAIGKDNKAGTENEDGDKFTLGVAIGYKNISNGSYSLAMGHSNKSTDTASLSFGYSNEATAICSLAIGNDNISSGKYSNAIGGGNIASGECSIAIGELNESKSGYCVAIGKNNKAGTQNEDGDKFSLGVAIGLDNISNGSYSLAMGNGNKSTDTASFSFGYSNEATAICSLAIGNDNISSGKYSNAIGGGNTASGECSIAIGELNESKNDYCIAIGKNNKAGIPNENGDKATLGVAIGLDNISNGAYSLAMGNGNKSTDIASLSFGYSNEATSVCCNAIGNENIASSDYANAIGNKNISSAYCSTTLGENNTNNSRVSFVHGISNTLNGNDTNGSSFCFGSANNLTNTMYCSIFGMSNEILGVDDNNPSYNFISGSFNKFRASYSNAFGSHINISQYSCTGIGHGIEVGQNYCVGMGNVFSDVVTDFDNPTNQNLTILFDYQNGNGYFDGSADSGNADYAEYFESVDGEKIDVGYFVSFSENSEKIEIGNKEILGITSATPCIVGDSAFHNWNDRYLKDDFGRYLEELKDVKRVIGQDKNNNHIYETVKEMVRIENPNYDNSKRYIPRKDRDEWVAVGLLGKLYVYFEDGEDLKIGNYVTSNSDGKAIKCNRGDDYSFRVLEVKDNLVKVLFK